MSKGRDFFSVKYQFIYSVISAISFTISQICVHELKHVIHHSIDTIYIALAMTLIMPSFVLGDYSMHPDKFMIDRYEILYYLLSGICFWVFHS